MSAVRLSALAWVCIAWLFLEGFSIAIVLGTVCPDSAMPAIAGDAFSDGSSANSCRPGTLPPWFGAFAWVVRKTRG